METKIITALLIEDDLDDAVLIQRYLASSPRVIYKVTHVDRLADGLKILNSISFDVILLDLGLPDAPAGIKTFEKAYAHASSLPIIVLTGYDDDTIAVESVQKGAQDYIVKGQVTGNMLGRAIRYAIERKKLLVQLEQSTSEIKKLRGSFRSARIARRSVTIKAIGPRSKYISAIMPGRNFLMGSVRNARRKYIRHISRRIQNHNVA